MKGLKQFGTLKPKCHRMDGMGWDGISPDKSISRSPGGDNKEMSLSAAIKLTNVRFNTIFKCQSQRCKCYIGPSFVQSSFKKDFWIPDSLQLKSHALHTHWRIIFSNWILKVSICRLLPKRMRRLRRGGWAYTPQVCRSQTRYVAQNISQNRMSYDLQNFRSQTW